MDDGTTYEGKLAFEIADKEFAGLHGSRAL